MKFKVTSSGSFYSKEQKVKLEELGFEFSSDAYFVDTPWYKEKDGNDIEVKTLGALLSFVNVWGSVVLTIDTIEIYDEYRE